MTRKVLVVAGSGVFGSRLASSARGALRTLAVRHVVNRTGGGLLIGSGLLAAAWRKAPA